MKDNIKVEDVVKDFQYRLENVSFSRANFIRDKEVEVRFFTGDFEEVEEVKNEYVFHLGCEIEGKKGEDGKKFNALRIIYSVHLEVNENSKCTKKDLEESIMKTKNVVKSQVEAHIMLIFAEITKYAFNNPLFMTAK